MSWSARGDPEAAAVVIHDWSLDYPTLPQLTVSLTSGKARVYQRRVSAHFGGTGVNDAINTWFRGKSLPQPLQIRRHVASMDDG